MRMPIVMHFALGIPVSGIELNKALDMESREKDVIMPVTFQLSLHRDCI
ncbi:hypothetical protein [Macrococcus carouselicus]|nr:hypothetical protein [Macrococcus carouselicus]